VVDIYMSTTTPVTLDVDHLHGTAEGTLYSVDSLPTAGVPRAEWPSLAPGTTYYVVAQSRNAAGVDITPSPEVAAQTRQIDDEDFAATHIYAFQMDVGSLVGGEFELTEGTVNRIEARGVNDEVVGMSAINTADPAAINGFYALGPKATDGSQPLRVHFPLDGSKPNIVSGQSEFDTLKVNDSTVFDGPVSVSPGERVTLVGSIQAPKNAPSANADWHTVAHDMTGLEQLTHAGLTKGHDGNWYSAADDGWVRWWNDTGAKVGGVALSPGYLPHGGIVYASHHGGRYYLLVKEATSDRWFVEVRDTSFTLLSEHDIATAYYWGQRSARDPAIGWDHVNGKVLVAAWDDDLDLDGAVDITSITYAADATWTGTAMSFITPTGYVYDFDLGFVARVNTEAGDRYVFRRIGAGVTNSNFQVFTTARVQQTSEQWPTAEAAGVRGGWFDGTRFWSIATTGKRYRYETGRAMWTTGSATREVQTTLHRTGSYETTPSPKASVVLPKRARLSVTFQSIPTGDGSANFPDAARVYVGTGTGAANTAMNLEKTVPAPNTSWSLDTAVAQENSATHPPTVNGFPTATPSGVDATTNGPFSVDSSSNGSVGTGTFRDSVRAAVGAAGTLGITTGAAGSITTVAITFPAGRFTSPPVITPTVETTRPDLHAVSARNVTATGCDILLYRNAGSTIVTVNWIARPPG
ncbi:MAG: hypothetical protein ACRD0P_19345, partial [Stackebrandtia sp.]